VLLELDRVGARYGPVQALHGVSLTVGEGEVVAVGPGRLTDDGKRISLEVKKGDRVLIGKYSGTDVKIDGTEYVILREDDVLGVLAADK